MYIRLTSIFLLFFILAWSFNALAGQNINLCEIIIIKEVELLEPQDDPEFNFVRDIWGVETPFTLGDGDEMTFSDAALNTLNTISEESPTADYFFAGYQLP